MRRRSVGRLPDGRPVDAFALEHGRLRAEVVAFGAALAALWAPDRRGRLRNVVLGYRTLEDRVRDAKAGGGAYLGATVGRYAGRIGGACFALDGVTHRLAANEGSTTLHGGPGGLHGVLWRATPLRERDRPGVRLETTSPAGDQGFPGTLRVQVTYTLGAGGDLRLVHEAWTDAPTVVNLTNHASFDLGGEGSGGVAEHRLAVAASRHAVLDAARVPTGEIAAVAGTPLDLRHARALGGRIGAGGEPLGGAGDLDHPLLLDRGAAARGEPVTAARLHHPSSGRTLRVRTTEPALQVYGGGGLDGTVVGPSGRAYRAGDGLALEAQHLPDSPNRPGFPTTTLRPGEHLRSTTELLLGVRPR